MPGCGYARRYFIFFLLFIFSLAQRKNEQRCNGKYHISVILILKGSRLPV